MTVAVGLKDPNQYPKSILTLSAAPELLLPNDRSAAERFEDLLALAERARRRGDTRLAEDYIDRIVDEMSAGSAL
jgi:hypothetical protein